jgi:hypothetical protein
MKSALGMLLSLLVVTAGGAPLEVCRHGSGTVHLFFGAQCAGEEGHSHHPASGDHHEHGHSEEHPHGDDHEPCTHETIELAEDFAPLTHRIACDSLTVPHVFPLAPTALLPDLSRLYSGAYYAYSRAPPDDPGPAGQFATTVRLLI